MTLALITGSTSGLGLEFAWQLAGSGHDLVLVARNEDRLAAVAAQIEAVSGTRVSILPADISVQADVERVARRLLDPVDPIGLLVNNTGHSVRASFLEGEIEEFLEEVDFDVRATLILAHAAATAMTRKGAGAILNVSSMAGFTATNLSAAAKSWVVIFTEYLAQELEGTGVSATVLIPGFVHTESHHNAAVNMEGAPRVTWLKAPFVVQHALKDVAAGQVVSVPSLAYNPEALGRATPGVLRRAFQSEAIAHAMSKARMRKVERAAARRSMFDRLLRKPRD
ncbi:MULTISPECIES: SDR family NAD(P)-dependent oxidoreductase [Dermabacter]|uniref:SDR family NAD(P)-dependent oxidoreductase n=1 Tax=Dermabacter TaxID=36739 RepID=UPI0021A2DC66|nr:MULTISPECIES: SDR family NAD(P)-dependent oxidoreductase [Dermabacter]MCT1955049.1 SDR family NAD(P)-dependent oxidoreductase [Dermabacter hominis]MCT2055061.1 SDR family NAD(P)-dependent oxidoreductase [Dermabacter hominis]MCT2083258.1 SDR family NAD(P)-dependent oxidoreductase [Dermabacter hominis]MCT2091347.1 SDR family NAD(P)-dependent oxidoreductase [Dermabacter hominis]MCT2189565.1 SDR family NAD(P)-dependent oxidoreductase [Dermabacter hominis]